MMRVIKKALLRIIDNKVETILFNFDEVEYYTSGNGFAEIERELSVSADFSIGCFVVFAFAIDEREINELIENSETSKETKWSKNTVWLKNLKRDIEKAKCYIDEIEILYENFNLKMHFKCKDGTKEYAKISCEDSKLHLKCKERMNLVYETIDDDKKLLLFKNLRLLVRKF